MIKTILKLLPRGLAWLIPAGYMRALLEGVSLEFDRVASFLKAVATEANPATAISCLEEWFDQYGMAWTDTGSVGSKQEDALSRFITIGAQDIVYLQRSIDEAGFDGVTISETPSVLSRFTAILSVAWNEVFSFTFSDVAKYQGETITLGLWIQDVDLGLPVTLTVIEGFGGGDILGVSEEITLTNTMELYTLDFFVPLEMPFLGLIQIRLDVIGTPTEATYFNTQAGFVADALLPVGEWLSGNDVVLSNTLFSGDDIFELNITGAVNTDADELRLASLIQRLMPAHIEPAYFLIQEGNVWGDGLYGDAVCAGR
jgi:hypothetical protein